MKSNLTFKQQHASHQDILAHLLAVDNLHVPKLSSRVNLLGYSNKIYRNALTFEMWFESSLVGLIGVYVNNEESGFITNVSVFPEFSGKGIASILLKNCIVEAKKKVHQLVLEVSSDNNNAIRLYEKFNFKRQSENGNQVVMKLKLNKGG